MEYVHYPILSVDISLTPHFSLIEKVHLHPFYIFQLVCALCVQPEGTAGMDCETGPDTTPFMTFHEHSYDHHGCPHAFYSLYPRCFTHFPTHFLHSISTLIHITVFCLPVILDHSLVCDLYRLGVHSLAFQARSPFFVPSSNPIYMHTTTYVHSPVGDIYS